MTCIAYVDPGVHASGVAWYRDHVLILAQLRPSGESLTRFADTACTIHVDGCFGELPKVYSKEAKARMGKNVDDADIVALAYALGRMTSALPTNTYEPAQWKGNRDKTLMHDRMLGRGKFAGREPLLTPAELAVLAGVACRPSLMHNVYDATAMGLVLEGRWK